MAFLTITQTHLEAGKPLVVEVARYIQNDAFFDNVWEPYHGMAWLSGSGDLLEEGRLQLGLEAAPLLPWSTASGGGAAVVSGLPVYTPG